MQPVLIGIGVYLVCSSRVGLLVSRRIASESDYLLAGRRLGASARGVLDLRDLVRRGDDRRRRGLDLHATACPAAPPIRSATALCLVVLGVVHRGAALAAAVHDVRRLVPRALLAGRRAARRAPDGADVGALGRGADPRIRPSRQRRRRISRCRSRSRRAAAFVIIYTVAGGLLADVVTDFIQGIAVIVGLVVLLIAVGNANGGVGELVAMIDPQRLALFSTANATPLEILEAWAVPVCGSLLAVEMLSRILGCKTAATARNATFARRRHLPRRRPRSPWRSGSRARRSCRGSRSPSSSSTLLAEQHLSTFVYVCSRAR